MSKESPKKALFAEFAAVARALGSEHRLDLLEHLAQAEQSVELLAERTGIPFASVSQHLQALRKAGLVSARATGAETRLYRIANDNLLRLAFHGASTGTSVAIWSSFVTTSVRSGRIAGSSGAVPVTPRSL